MNLENRKTLRSQPLFGMTILINRQLFVYDNFLLPDHRCRPAVKPRYDWLLAFHLFTRTIVLYGRPLTPREYNEPSPLFPRLPVHPGTDDISRPRLIESLRGYPDED